jgi:hypothetical protein
MIRIFNSSIPGERELPMDDVNVVTMKMDYDSTPYILFEHSDYPLGALKAVFDGSVWQCNLD